MSIFKSLLFAAEKWLNRMKSKAQEEKSKTKREQIFKEKRQIILINGKSN